MKKILLLGNDNTFGDFPSHLRDLISPSLPRLTVVSKVYPRYETRGDLSIAVNKLRIWLEDTVLDLETSNSNPNPMLEPTVRTIFMCHSMGGIVAAEVLLTIIKEYNTIGDNGKGGRKLSMWPFVQGILAFDTPYLGLSPRLAIHTGAGGLKTANEALEKVRMFAGMRLGESTVSSTGTVEETATTVAVTATATAAANPKVLMIEEGKERKDREGGREKERERDRAREREKDKKDKEGGRHREGDREKERDRERERDKERERGKKDKEGERERKSSRSEASSRSSHSRRESKGENKHERRDSRSERTERRESKSERSSSNSTKHHSSSSKTDRPKSERKSSSSSSISNPLSQKDATATAAALVPDIPLPKSPTWPSTLTSSETPVSPSTTTSVFWPKWSKAALFAGAAASFAAAGVAAYMKRTEIASGFSWATSHLEFVGVLGKTDQLRQRLKSVTSIPNVGFANLYTSMGPNSLESRSISMPNAPAAVREYLMQERTFCSEPTSSEESEFTTYFRKQINTKAKDEIEMHTGMFDAKSNPNYYDMRAEARDLVVEWVREGRLTKG